MGNTDTQSEIFNLLRVKGVTMRDKTRNTDINEENGLYWSRPAMYADRWVDGRAYKNTK